MYKILTILLLVLTIDADISFISSLMGGTLDALELLTSISLRVPVHPKINHSLSYIPSNSNS